MTTDGLQRMLNFLNFLNEKKIHSFIEQQDEEGIRVTLTLVGMRIEVVFTVEDMTFSIFKGEEDVITNERMLHELIRENWS